MSATCHLVLACLDKAVIAIRLNDKSAREILCCQYHLDELKKIGAITIAAERVVGPQEPCTEKP